MNAMYLPADYSPDGDRDDTYRYGDYVPPSPEEKVEIDCDLCGAECLCLVIPLRRCNLHVCTSCRLEHAEELKRLTRLAVRVAA